MSCIIRVSVIIHDTKNGHANLSLFLSNFVLIFVCVLISSVFFLNLGVKDMTYDFDKTPDKKRKLKMPLIERNEDRKSTLSVRCSDFITVNFSLWCSSFTNSYSLLIYLSKTFGFY